MDKLPSPKTEQVSRPSELELFRATNQVIDLIGHNQQVTSSGSYQTFKCHAQTIAKPALIFSPDNQPRLMAELEIRRPDSSLISQTGRLLSITYGTETYQPSCYILFSYQPPADYRRLFNPRLDPLMTTIRFLDRLKTQSQPLSEQRALAVRQDLQQILDQPLAIDYSSVLD